MTPAALRGCVKVNLQVQNKDLSYKMFHSVIMLCHERRQGRKYKNNVLVSKWRQDENQNFCKSIKKMTEFRNKIFVKFWNLFNVVIYFRQTPRI